jgi:subtilisin family serine protease
MRLVIASLWSLALCTSLLAAPAGQGVLIAIDDPALLTARDDRPQAADPALLAALQDHDLSARWLVPAGARSPLARRYLLLEGAADPAAACRDLRALPGVAAAMVNGTRSLFWVPNDPYFGTQWYLQPGNAAGVALPEAWDLETGDPSTVIAIVDTGVDWSHPDLAAKCWINQGEIPGNGIDDDGNGFIDDVRGWDCGNQDADARPDPYYEMGLDVGWHGTHCAGIAAAATNNGIGIAGAAPGCLVMPLKVTNAASEFTDAAITTAFIYAITSGADVISMSFGGPGDGGAAAFFQDLVDQALAAGIVCVAAAGNNNDASLMYPAACTGVISVGATDASGQRASYSTYGHWVTVNAPGSQIWATIQTNYSWDLLTQWLYMLLYSWDGSNPYMYADGTSMACPLVAGVCGLVRSRAPQLGPAAVRQLLLDTGQTVSYDQPLGVKVNAQAALAALESTAVPARRIPLAVHAAPNPFNPRTEIRLVLADAVPVAVAIHDVRGRQVRTLLDGETRPAGVLRVVWDGLDDQGRALASGLYVARVRAGTETATAKLLLAR